MTSIKEIVIVSDGTGKTAKRLMDAVLAQYADTKAEFSVVNIYQQVRTKRKANDILTCISRDVLVIFSIISNKLREYFHDELHKRKVLHLDVLNPMLKTMKKFLGYDPNYKPGLLQIIDDNYYSKVDAIGYTVEHDDGRGYQLKQADIVLLGLSRTCKTPISMYMACNHGLRVANIPIVHNDYMKPELSKRLRGINRVKVFGLMMHEDVLANVRMERSSILVDRLQDQAHLEEYFNVRKIRDEIRFCRRLYEDMDVEEINVTRRAIEEVSLEIMRKLGLNSRDSL